MSKRKYVSETEVLRELLEEKRDELNARIDQRRKELLIDQEPEDEVAIALRNSSTGIAIANIERDVHTLFEIELSLRRLGNGEYGICGVCGDEIPTVRLKAIPWTRSCVECAGGRAPRATQHRAA